jgi:hypothetical protein
VRRAASKRLGAAALQRHIAAAVAVLAAGLVLLPARGPLTGGPTASAASCSSELFFSEYVEGGFINRALEIHNDTAATIALDGVYFVDVFGDGSGSATSTVALHGSIAAGANFVLARGDMAGVTEDQMDGGLLFDGNDAVALRKNGFTSMSVD